MKEQYVRFLVTINTFGLITGPPKQKHHLKPMETGVMTNNRLGLDILERSNIRLLFSKQLISLFLSFPYFVGIKMRNKNSIFLELLF